MTTLSAPAKPSSARLLQAAVRDGRERYFARCRRRIPGFVARHMSLRGAARRYYPPRPLEIARLALSVMLTPFMAMIPLILWPLGHGRNRTWLAIKSTVQRLTLPRAHALLATAVRREVFGGQIDPADPGINELERCIVSSRAFAGYLRALLEERHPEMPEAEIEATVRTLIPILQTGTGADASAELAELAAHARQSVGTIQLQGDLESIVAGEAARSDVINTILTGVIAKVTLGHLKLGAYGIALLAAPPLYFRWSNGREEKIRRTIDHLLPDGPFSLSRAGWHFNWTDSFESFALVVGLFLGLSAIFAAIGYLLAPPLAPAWRRTGLPAWSLRRAVEASRRELCGGGSRRVLSPEVFASKIGDLAEFFLRSS